MIFSVNVATHTNKYVLYITFGFFKHAIRRPRIVHELESRNVLERPGIERWMEAECNVKQGATI